MADAYRARFPQTVLPDLFPEKAGPLCGIVTGLEWLEGDVLATFPCDTPFLPLDLVAQLERHPAPAVAREMPVCGLWPKSCLAALKTHVGGSVRGAAEALGGRECDIDAAAHAFFNVNAPQDLQDALRLLAQADEASRRP
jgi:molybdopterin-guanine dinucleotide biosynthesis protein A